MKLIKSLIDYTEEWALPNIYFFTANQIVRSNGELVMGAGNAKAARDGVKHSARIMGAAFKTHGCLVYCARMSMSTEKYLGALTTKKHFKDNSELEFVKESLRQLYHMAKINPTLIFHVPYPAIGRGGLTRDVLDEYVFKLPDNVYIYAK